jgi:hypothetical protein
MVDYALGYPSFGTPYAPDPSLGAPLAPDGRPMSDYVSLLPWQRAPLQDQYDQLRGASAAPVVGQTQTTFTGPDDNQPAPIPSRGGSRVERTLIPGDAADVSGLGAGGSPGFWQGLSDFGFGLMAAGGRSGATTLGAVGEAGLSAGQLARERQLLNARTGLVAQQTRGAELQNELAGMTVQGYRNMQAARNGSVVPTKAGAVSSVMGGGNGNAMPGGALPGSGGARPDLPFNRTCRASPRLRGRVVADSRCRWPVDLRVMAAVSLPALVSLRRSSA